ncbi:MAG: type II toxin-antitoxin system VapC family toxin [Phycisphaerae bacterium]
MLVDTSVVVACYVPESISDRTQRILSDADVRPTICSLTEVEFHSAISRLVRMKALSADSGRRITEQFRTHIQQGVYGFCPMTQAAYELARDWLGSFRTSLRTLDALHLAVARTGELTFVTADKPLARAGRKLGVAVRSV